MTSRRRVLGARATSAWPIPLAAVGLTLGSLGASGTSYTLTLTDSTQGWTQAENGLGFQLGI